MTSKKKSEGNFINEFTKEMINNSKLKIESEKNKPKRIIIKEEPEKIKPQIVIEQPRPVQKPISPPIQTQPAQKIITPIQPTPVQKPVFKPLPTQTPIQPQIKPIPPKPQLPPQKPINNIPIPPKPQLQPGEIDFGKILFLIRDQLITSIECPGVNKNVIIKKAGNITRTQITLEKEEIMSIIKTFSEKAKLPLVEGMLIARTDNLEISAVVPTSASASPSFIIKKEPVTMQNRAPTQLMKPIMQTTPNQPQKSVPFVPPQNPSNK